MVCEFIEDEDGRLRGICLHCGNLTPAADEDYCRVCLAEGRQL